MSIPFLEKRNPAEAGFLNMETSHYFLAALTLALMAALSSVLPSAFTK